MQALHTINQQLKEAIAAKDKRKLLALYDEANGINLEDEEPNELEVYDELVDKANEILLA